MQGGRLAKLGWQLVESGYLRCISVHLNGMRTLKIISTLCLLTVLTSCGSPSDNKDSKATASASSKPVSTAELFNDSVGPEFEADFRNMFGTGADHINDIDLDTIKVTSDKKFDTITFEADVNTFVKNTATRSLGGDCLKDPSVNYFQWIVFKFQNQLVDLPIKGFVFKLHWVIYEGKVKTDKYGNEDSSGVKRIEYGTDVIGIPTSEYSKISDWTSFDPYALHSDSLVTKERHSKSYERCG